MLLTKKNKWLPWVLYYIGRGCEIFGLLVVTWSMILFFGSSQMKTMLAWTGTGAAFFIIGWFIAKDDPERKKEKKP